MFSALAEPPPDSGVQKSAEAPVASTRSPVSAAMSASAKTRREVRKRAGAKAAGILFMRRRSASPVPRGSAHPLSARSSAAEVRRALLEERGDALAEVRRLRHLLLARCLEFELLVEVGVHPLVDLVLGAG